MVSRVMVIGLDCAPPSLVFDRWREHLPNIARLMERGSWGPLRSSIPPITVPAWTCMVSGRDPGELGLYGFRNRVPGSYDMVLPTSRDLRHKRVWDWLGENGKRVAALFVPLTWPPTPVRGQMVSCFLTPGPDEPWAFPRSFREKLESRHGAYVPDVEGFRTDQPDRVIEGLYTMARQHFAMAEQVWTEERPDFLMMVEMGPDRLHHALWHHIDPAHPRYEPGNRYEAEAQRYYTFLDERIGALLDHTDLDTAVMIVSDHGARAMQGGVRVNEWLRREGWEGRAWGEGGYYARIWLNVCGREPDGVVEPADFERERERLGAALEAMCAPGGTPLGNRVLKPEDVYRETRGVPPDLMVFFGDLALRSLGTGSPGDDVLTTENDTGLDGCNHDWDGIYVLAGGGAPRRDHVEGLSIYDVTPTVLGLMGVACPPGLLGTDRSGA